MCKLHLAVNTAVQCWKVKQTHIFFNAASEATFMFALFSRNPIAKITITEIVNFTGAILALKFKVLVWTWVTNFCNLRAKIQKVIGKV